MDAMHHPVPKGHLRGSTLLESVLAMGLLAGVMSLAVLMHARTLTTFKGYARMQAWSATDAALAGIADGLPLDRTWPAPPGTILTVEGTTIAPGLRRIHLSCKGGTGIILERQVLLPAP